MILAGRHGGRLKEVAEKYDMPFRVFAPRRSCAAPQRARQYPVGYQRCGAFVCTAEPAGECCVGNRRSLCRYKQRSRRLHKLDPALRSKAAEKGLAIVRGLDAVLQPSMYCWIRRCSNSWRHQYRRTWQPLWKQVSYCRAVFSRTSPAASRKALRGPCGPGDHRAQNGPAAGQSTDCNFGPSRLGRPRTV